MGGNKKHKSKLEFVFSIIYQACSCGLQIINISRKKVLVSFIKQVFFPFFLVLLFQFLYTTWQNTIGLLVIGESRKIGRHLLVFHIFRPVFGWNVFVISFFFFFICYLLSFHLVFETRGHIINKATSTIYWFLFILIFIKTHRLNNVQTSSINPSLTSERQTEKLSF